MFKLVRSSFPKEFILTISIPSVCSSLLMNIWRGLSFPCLAISSCLLDVASSIVKTLTFLGNTLFKGPPKEGLQSENCARGRGSSSFCTGIFSGFSWFFSTLSTCSISLASSRDFSSGLTITLPASPCLGIFFISARAASSRPSTFEAMRSALSCFVSAHSFSLNAFSATKLMGVSTIRSFLAAHLAIIIPRGSLVVHASLESLSLQSLRLPAFVSFPVNEVEPS
mmetsp:Transcript_3979/g.7409  ORF Transcript_3979/g.7409 Transcript_3979/m.7409 type:complete len:225 (-) Transcript_3979:314-988(-)